MRLLPTEIMSGALAVGDISLGDDPGINGQLWDVNRALILPPNKRAPERWTVRADMPQSFITGALS